MVKRERVVELDFVRVVSMLSVILLHVSSGYLFLETKASFFGLSIAYIINQGVRYCVPLFFLVSGFSLELTYREEGYGTFLKKRLNKVLLPYLFWTALYYLDALESFSLRELVDAFCWGMSAPHLYFIVALVQLYLLYIPVRRALEKKPGLTLSLVLLVSFLIQWAAYLMLFQVYFLPIELRPYLLKTFFPWIFCFTFGIYLAKKKESWLPIVQPYKWALFTSSVIVAVFYIADSVATASYNLSVKPVLFLYVPLVFFTLYALGTLVSKTGGLAWGIDVIARHSMTVFFCHIFVLTYCSEHLVLHGTSGLLILAVLTIIGSLLFALVFDALLQKAKKLLRSLP